MSDTVSIIIPVLNEEAIIGGTMEHLCQLRGRFQVIVVDGGSNDETANIAAQALRSLPGSKLVPAPRGRGPQLNAGARAAEGGVFVFLHADTVLPDDALEQVRVALEDHSIIGGNFRIAFTGEGFSALLFGWIYSVRRWFGIYYGDSAIWVRRDVFDRLGGFLDAPIMEDYDFCRRLERSGKTARLAGPVISSSRRWAGGRTLKTVFIWLVI
ncbi:MAG TPA: TIGR04283 family arsenosugar biosynthesis glycosyltransferase, partial [Blastocatellia bacterium]|nr:TIGR04283 family arsenosugar biosynthesis glycosyltransferase [Blastocatellia bacterium]